MVVRYPNASGSCTESSVVAKERHGLSDGNNGSNNGQRKSSHASKMLAAVVLSKAVCGPV